MYNTHVLVCLYELIWVFFVSFSQIIIQMITIYKVNSFKVVKLYNGLSVTMHGKKIIIRLDE